MTDAETSPGQGSTSELDALLAANKDIIDSILTEPSAEEVEKARVLGIDTALKSIVANDDLKNFLLAYRKKSGSEAEATLLRADTTDGTIGPPILTMRPDGAMRIIFNPSDTSPDRVYPKIHMIQTRAIMDGEKIVFGDGLNLEVPRSHPYALDLLNDGTALIRDGNHGGRPYLFIDDVMLAPAFKNATAELINTTLTSDVKRMSQEFAPLRMAPVPGAQPPQGPTTT